MKIFYKLLIVAFISFSCESDQERTERFFNLGNQALSAGNFDLAVDYYDQALKKTPNYASALNNRGVAKIESDHPYEAILDYNKAIQIDADYLDALFNRAYAYEEIGQYKNALNDIETIQSLARDSAFVYFYQGLVQAKMRAYDASLESFQTANDLQPLNPETLINTASVYYFLEQYDTAGLIANQALALSADDANAFNLLSLIAIKKGELDIALAEINRALDIVPGEPYFLNNRGFIHLQMENLERAIEDINRSIVLNPKNGWAYRNKGIWKMKNGDIQEAIGLFDRALRTGEFIDELYYYQGLAYQKLEDKGQACESWLKGIENQEKSSRRMYDQNCD